MQVNNYININQAAGKLLNNNAAGVSREKEVKGFSFEDILRSKTTDGTEADMSLKFSKHASTRLEDRNIEITDDLIGRLTDGYAKALNKGIKESLVMVDSLAFIVNVPNKTVVTAMDQTDSKENVFTNIDGAVIV